MLQEPSRHGVARLVVRHRPPLLLADHLRIEENPAQEPPMRIKKRMDDGIIPRDHLVLLLQAADDPVDGGLEMLHGDLDLLAAGGDESGLVADVRDVGAGEAGGERRQPLGVEGGLVVELELLQIDPENLIAALDVGLVDGDLAVEPPGPEQGLVEDVGPVGAGEDDHAGGGAEAVHLHEQLVQGALALVIGAGESAAAPGAADGVDLVDEDDAGRAAPGLLEEAPHAGGAHADEHLHEVGPGDGEEGHAGLAGGGLGEQRLARAGRPDEEGALGDLGAQVLVLLGVPEEMHELHDLLLRLVAAGHVLEKDLIFPTRPWELIHTTKTKA